MKNKSHCKFGFSMAEMLITIAALGLLAAIVTPSLNKFQPDKNATMFKKSYMQIERIIYEFINDSELYPEKVGKVGLDNTDKITYNGTEYGDDTEDSDNAKLKFACLLKSKLNTVTNDNDSCEHFKTTDGVEWFILTPDDAPNDIANILLDVNGNAESQGPNNFVPCKVVNPATDACLAGVTAPAVDNTITINKTDINLTVNEPCPSSIDIFLLRIGKNGNIKYSGGCEAEMLSKLKVVEPR